MENSSVIILAGAVFSFAALLHGVCGFGFSLVAVSVLSLFIEPKIVVPLNLVAATGNCLYLAWLMRKSILFKETVVLVVLAFIFVPIGTLFLRQMDRSIIMRSLGIVILLVAGISLFKAEHLRIFSSRIFQYIAGATGGVLCGAFNTPGPPLVLYSYNCHWPVINAKANLQFIFSAMTLIAYVTFTAAGLMNLKIIGLGLIYAPFVIFFTFLGVWIASRLKVKNLTIAVNLLLLALGITLIIKG